MKVLYFFIFLFSILSTSCNEVKKTTESTQEISFLTTNLQKNAFENYEKGIDFYAEDENGLWTLALDFDKHFEFKTKKGITYSAAAVLPIKAQDFNVKRYRTVTNKGELIIQIIESDCVTTVTNNKGYTVTINYKPPTNKDYIDFKGCGSYIPNYKLHNIWAIIEVDGIKINPSMFKKNPPILEINCSKQTIMGADGCNTFRGKIYNEYNLIYFNQLAATKMACEEQQNIAKKINELFNEKKLSYSFENNLLILKQHNTKRMALKHID